MISNKCDTSHYLSKQLVLAVMVELLRLKEENRVMSKIEIDEVLCF